MTDEATLGKGNEAVHVKKHRTSRKASGSHRSPSQRQPNGHRGNKIILRQHPGLPRPLQVAKPSGSFKWMEQLPRKVCVARKSPAHVLLRCRQLIDQDRKQPMEFAGTEVDALRYRLRVRMETMWEELKIPHIDRDTFISVHGGCLASMARQVQLLTVHHQCTLRVLHCIQVREDLLLHTTNEIRVNDVWLQSMIQASVAVVEAVEMWRDTMWYPHAFRSTHAPNYLIKMTTDCSLLLKHQVPSCPVLHPLDPPHRGTVHVGHVRVMAPTGRQWRGARILKDEGDTHAQVVTMHGQWATLNQFVPLLKWNTTPNDDTSITPVKKARTIDDTAPCFVYQSWTHCVHLTTVVAIKTLQRRWRHAQSATGGIHRRRTGLHKRLLLTTPQRLLHVIGCTRHRYMSMDDVVVVPHKLLRCEIHADGNRTAKPDAIALVWTSKLLTNDAAARRICTAWRAHRGRHVIDTEKLGAYRHMWQSLRWDRKPVDMDSHDDNDGCPPYRLATSPSVRNRQFRSSRQADPRAKSATTTSLGPPHKQASQAKIDSNNDKCVVHEAAAKTIQRWWQQVNRDCPPRTVSLTHRVVPTRRLQGPRMQSPLKQQTISPLKRVLSRFHVWWNRFRHASDHGGSSNDRRVLGAVVTIQQLWRAYRRTTKHATTFRALQLSTPKSTLSQVDMPESTSARMVVSLSPPTSD